MNGIQATRNRGALAPLCITKGNSRMETLMNGDFGKRKEDRFMKLRVVLNAIGIGVVLWVCFSLVAGLAEFIYNAQRIIGG